MRAEQIPALRQALDEHARRLRTDQVQIAQLFSDDPNRSEAMVAQAAELQLDYSRHLLDRRALSLLLELAQACDMPEAIRAMFRGDKVNITEQRPALHVALRGHRPATCPDIPARIEAMQAQMSQISESVRAGQWQGFRGRPVRHIINIGIGGSDLGPAMVSQALGGLHHPDLRCDFVSNIDPHHMDQTLAQATPDQTLFIVSSKSFGTLETLENARRARRWLLAKGASEADLAQHFIAITSRPQAACDFGISAHNILPMWDWVGGRYSLWSAIGLPLAITAGMPVFRQLLHGAHSMDEHFLHTPLASNMPVIMALLAVWYSQFWHCQSQVVLPYAQALNLFPAYLQQLDMESLGKGVDINGKALDFKSGQVIWGSVGTNGQHSFHQLLHQGSHLIPADFIAIARPRQGRTDSQHQQLLANCLAQSQALANGKSAQQAEQELLQGGMARSAAALLAPHLAVPGNKPGSVLLMPSLTPANLGALLAAYEHKVYAQSILCHINAFDQWGVELGKALSKPAYAALTGTQTGSALDATSKRLISQCRHWQQAEHDSE